MKIISLNIAGMNNFQERIEKITNFLDEQAPDIVVLQEVIWNEQENQASDINRRLQSPYEYASFDIAETYQPSVGVAYTEGLAVLTREEQDLHEIWRFQQADDDRHERIAQVVEVKSGLKIINVHFSNNKYSIEQLQQTIMKDQGKSIILGDFNIFSLSEAAHMYENMYSSSYQFKKYISFPSENLTLDYALIPSSYMFTDISTSTGLSDHNAIICSVALP